MDRRDPRFIERRKEEDRKILVTFVKKFNDQKKYSGRLHDLTYRGAKIVVDNSLKDELQNYSLKHILLKFRFNLQTPAIITEAYIKRIDPVGEKIGVVLLFVNTPDESKKLLIDLCEKYNFAQTLR